MEAIHAHEIMIPIDEYPSIQDSATLEEAIKKFESFQVIKSGEMESFPRTLLVFNDNNELCGLLRRRDILRGLEPDFLRSKPLMHRKDILHLQVDPNLTEFMASVDELKAGIQKQAKKSILNIMQPIKVYVEADDHVMKVIYEIVTYNIYLVPVYKGDRVVGVVRSRDVLAEASRVIFDN